MKVYVNGDGLVDFRPTEIYRFDNREDLTQLRGQIRIIRYGLEVTTGVGQEWMDHNYWYQLSQIQVSSSEDLNMMIGLPIKVGGTDVGGIKPPKTNIIDPQLKESKFIQEQIDSIKKTMNTLYLNDTNDLVHYQKLLKSYLDLASLK